MKDKALKLALDDLIAEYHMETSSFAKRVDEIFKQALAAPVQEPVAMPQNWFAGMPEEYRKEAWRVATPPAAKRQWVGLTDEEIEKACVPLGAAMLSFTEVARAIEAKLKELNT
jgi:hypothetical protein